MIQDWQSLVTAQGEVQGEWTPTTHREMYVVFFFFFIAAENTGPIFALCTRDRDIIIITTVEIILIYTK